MTGYFLALCLYFLGITLAAGVLGASIRLSGTKATIPLMIATVVFWPFFALWVLVSLKPGKPE